ncbi:transcription factor jumonji/aspartyl beta-hydroxylase domain containing protein [Pseudohyphozyma bogoriensis]|nr:transcription factor jumonji/aspartyl beta-hydroxylase domain containing protein [Pseudohyphozyma bogoriensis]
MSRPSKRVRLTADSSARTNPLQIKPLGNLLFSPDSIATRLQGLGSLSALPDELLLSKIFGALEGEDLIRMARVSKVFYGWSCVEGIWKGVYISKTSGKLLDWHGSWRSTYLHHFLLPPSTPAIPLVPTPSLHSDVLFQPSLCCSFSPEAIFLAPSFTETIPRIFGVGLEPKDLPNGPVILTGLMEGWAAMHDGERKWDLSTLAKRFPTTLLRAEATLTTLPEYAKYHDDCPLDESPLYLFESGFVNKTSDEAGVGGFGADYQVPQCFSEDLFSVMEDSRPDYRWLIVGPTKSGSTWHQDPNGTSAWNAVTAGLKAWVMFPPEVTPPGVFVSDDRATVEAPLSLAEWFLSYYQGAKAMYGPNAKDPSKRNKMLEGICRPGEIFYVPSGYWHIVINLEPSVAVTQNYVSLRELPEVLKFMRDRPEQVSGFSLPSASTGEQKDGGLGEEDVCIEGVFEKFVERLLEEGGAEVRYMVKMVLAKADGKGEEDIVGDGERRRKEGLWEKVKPAEEDHVGFSFGFDVAGEGDEFEEVAHYCNRAGFSFGFDVARKRAALTSLLLMDRLKEPTDTAATSVLEDSRSSGLLPVEYEEYLQMKKELEEVKGENSVLHQQLAAERSEKVAIIRKHDNLKKDSDLFAGDRNLLVAVEGSNCITGNRQLETAVLIEYDALVNNGVQKNTENQLLFIYYDDIRNYGSNGEYRVMKSLFRAVYLCGVWRNNGYDRPAGQGRNPVAHQEGQITDTVIVRHPALTEMRTSELEDLADDMYEETVARDTRKPFDRNNYANDSISNAAARPHVGRAWEGRSP